MNKFLFATALTIIGYLLGCLAGAILFGTTSQYLHILYFAPIGVFYSVDSGIGGGIAVGIILLAFVQLTAFTTLFIRTSLFRFILSGIPLFVAILAFVGSSTFGIVALV